MGTNDEVPIRLAARYLVECVLRSSLEADCGASPVLPRRIGLGMRIYTNIEM
jgi:hypothetical protein